MKDTLIKKGMTVILFIFYCNIWGYMCSIAHLSLVDRKDIFLTHLIIQSDVLIFPFAVIFFVVVCLGRFVPSYFCQLFHRVPGKLGLLFYYFCAVNDVCKWLGTLWFEGRMCLFAHCINSLIKHACLSKVQISSIWVLLETDKLRTNTHLFQLSVCSNTHYHYITNAPVTTGLYSQRANKTKNVSPLGPSHDWNITCCKVVKLL